MTHSADARVSRNVRVRVNTMCVMYTVCMTKRMEAKRDAEFYRVQEFITRRCLRGDPAESVPLRDLHAKFNEEAENECRAMREDVEGSLSRHPTYADMSSRDRSDLNHSLWTAVGPLPLPISLNMFSRCIWRMSLMTNRIRIKTHPHPVVCVVGITWRLDA